MLRSQAKTSVFGDELSNRVIVSAPSMKLSFSRSTILTVLTATVLLAAVPGEVRRFMQTHDVYLLSREFLEDIIARFSGPGRLRFIFQPTVAIALGLRDGRKDADRGSPPFILGLLKSRSHRSEFLRSALSSVRDIVAVAILLDVISQYLIFRNIHPGAALLVGPILIGTPYAVSRALTNRIKVAAKQRK